MTEAVKIRTPQSDGWLVISRAEYDKLRAHDHAGTSADGTVWAMGQDSSGATCLWQGIEIIEEASRL